MVTEHVANFWTLQLKTLLLNRWNEAFYKCRDSILSHNSHQYFTRTISRDDRKQSHRRYSNLP